RQPEIKASAVIETQSAHGPEPLAVLILRDDNANPETVVTRANESLAEYQRVRRWFVWQGEDFPRTATQKIRKQVVAEKVWAELAGETPSATTNHAEPLAEIVARLSKDASVRLDPSAKLETDLKLDSLGRVELLSALEDRYQVEIDEAAFTEATTIAEVEKVVREGRHEEAASYPYPRWQQRWPLSWLRMALFYLIIVPLTRVMGRPKITGREHLRDVRGPLVFT